MLDCNSFARNDSNLSRPAGDKQANDLFVICNKTPAQVTAKLFSYGEKENPLMTSLGFICGNGLVLRHSGDGFLVSNEPSMSEHNQLSVSLWCQLIPEGRGTIIQLVTDVPRETSITAWCLVLLFFFVAGLVSCNSFIDPLLSFLSFALAASLSMALLSTIMSHRENLRGKLKTLLQAEFSDFAPVRAAERRWKLAESDLRDQSNLKALQSYDTLYLAAPPSQVEFQIDRMEEKKDHSLQMYLSGKRMFSVAVRNHKLSVNQRNLLNNWITRILFHYMDLDLSVRLSGKISPAKNGGSRITFHASRGTLSWLAVFPSGMLILSTIALLIPQNSSGLASFLALGCFVLMSAVLNTCLAISDRQVIELIAQFGKTLGPLGGKARISSKAQEQFEAKKCVSKGVEAALRE